MNENQIKELSAPVRHYFREIGDAEFSGNTAVIDLRQQLAEIEVDNQRRAAEVTRLNAIIDELNKSHAFMLGENEHLVAIRPGILAKALAAENNLTEDDKIRERIEINKRQIEQIELAKPELEKMVNAASNNVGQTARQSENIEERLRDLLDKLRLELAIERAD